jgi:hypothetical protein
MPIRTSSGFGVSQLFSTGISFELAVDFESSYLAVWA